MTSPLELEGAGVELVPGAPVLAVDGALAEVCAIRAHTYRPSTLAGSGGLHTGLSTWGIVVEPGRTLPARGVLELPGIWELLGQVADALDRPLSTLRRAWIGTLHPGGRISPHVDTMPADRLRCHVPLFSNAEVPFRGGDRYVIMEPGRLYCVDPTVMHHTSNGGTTARIHLVSDWLHIGKIRLREKRY